ncbi:MAG: MASE3 domain-containing protein [Negativicutes bacterium]|nr:MASE3 domain-containing protein [Negativicutes bacterium]
MTDKSFGSAGGTPAHPPSPASLFINTKQWPIVLVGLGVMLLAYYVSTVNYRLFHAFAEGFTILVSFSIALIVLNNYHLRANNFTPIIGLAYACAAIFDLLHTLANLQAFPSTSNLELQLWIIARYLDGSGMILAVLSLSKQIRLRFVAAAYGLLSLAALAALFVWDIFPACFVPGQGLTLFKIYSEYLVALAIMVSALLLRHHRDQFHPRVYWLLLAFSAASALTELTLTIFLRMYSAVAIIGHLFKVLAFFFLYRAIIVTSLQEPYNLLFYQLNQANMRYRSLFSHMQNAFTLLKVIPDRRGRLIDLEVVATNPAFETIYGLQSAEITGRRLRERFPDWTGITYWIEILNEVSLTGQSLVTETYFTDIGKWLRIAAYRPEAGYVACTTEDITEQKLAENTILESRERFRALLKQSADAIIVYDSETSRIVEVNEAATQIFGYTEEELTTLTFHEITHLTPKEIDAALTLLKKTGAIPSCFTRIRHKDGHPIRVERTVSRIIHQGRQLGLATYRLITEERKLQEQIQAEVKLAGAVQKAMLPGDFTNRNVTIRTIYQPVHLVSGDYYGYKWSHDGTVLNGFVLDITGHGMATALQTSSISSILNEEMAKKRIWSAPALAKLNTQLTSYLPDDTFAALITFSLDLRRRRLTCVSGGINYFLASSKSHNGWVSLPGSFLGISEEANFGVISISVQQGDTFYFLTDGITDRLSREKPIGAHDYISTFKSLERLATGRTKSDDCSALCIAITGLSPYPHYFEFPDFATRLQLRPRVSSLLAEISGDASADVDLAVAEAITNAARHGKKIHLKINKVGQRLILRIRDDGPGFSGNAAIAKIQAAGLEETFDACLLSESGRGLPLMLSLMDRVIFNKRGNEVLLIKKLN